MLLTSHVFNPQCSVALVSCFIQIYNDDDDDDKIDLAGLLLVFDFFVESKFEAIKFR